MDTTTIEKKISAAIDDAEVRAVDLTGTSDHFEVTVVTPGFEEKSLIDRHRMIYAALGDAMRQEIHALTIKALTPEQYREGLVTDF